MTWCYTSYAITGKKESILTLNNILHGLEKTKKTPKNDFQPAKNESLEDLISKLGQDPRKYDCNGRWINRKLKKNGTVLSLEIETNLQRNRDFEIIIQDRFPDIKIFFIEQEFNSGIYNTNDTDGSWFPKCVIIDNEINGVNYYTPKGALRHLSKLSHTTITNWNDAEAFIRQHNKNADESGSDEHIWLYRPHICTD